jgi:uncharacterized protein (UPF0276 family)
MPAAGLGYRHEVWRSILRNIPPIEVLELTVDHYLWGGAEVRRAVESLRERCAFVAHGIGLSLGSASPPDRAYLKAVREVLDLIEAPWHSEHLAFTKVGDIDVAQLQPLPRTTAALQVVCENIGMAQDYLQRPLVLENITYYYSHPNSSMAEDEFLCEVHRRTGAFLLIDLENLYINSTNHDYDPNDFLRALPKNTVKSVHLAGGGRLGRLFIDSHDHPVPGPVFQLLRELLRTQEPDSLIVERDENLEQFDEVLQDIETLRTVRDECYA